MNNNLPKIFGIIFLLLISGISIYILSTKWEVGIDESTCKSITDEKEQGKCFYDLAIIKNDEVFCRKIEDSLEKESCHYDLAVKNYNLDICGRTGDKEESCFRKILEEPENKVLCEGIEIQSLQEKCYYHLAVVNNDLELCSKSGDNENRCKSEFKKEKGLIAYWSFDEGSGNTLHDDSGNGNDGTIYGTAWTSGISGSALSFDGNNDYVDIPDTSDFIFADEDFSFSAWVQIFDNVNDYRCFISLEDSGDDTYPYIVLGKLRNSNSNGRAYFQIVPDKNTSSIVKSINDGNALPKYQWMHLIGVVDYPNSIKLYLNGELQETNNLLSFNMADAQSLKLSFGREYDHNWPAYHRGLIDEVRIYDKALSSEEVKSLYSANAVNIKKTEIYITSFKYTETYNGSVYFSWKSNLPDKADNVRLNISCHNGLTIKNAVTGMSFTCGDTSLAFPPNNGVYLKFTNTSGSSIYATATLIPVIGGIKNSAYSKSLNFVIVPTVEQQKCADSDGGRDYYTKGETTVGGHQFEDECSQSTLTGDYDAVHEYYCLSNNSLGHVEVKCSNGCSNGECFGELMIPQCIDKDGGENIYVSSGAYDEYGSGQGDCCVKSSTGGSCYSEGSYLREGICKSNPKVGEWVFTEKIINCPGGCKDGACIEEEEGGEEITECIDSDGGKDYYTKSTVKTKSGISTGSYNDLCWNNGDVLHEWYCDFNNKPVLSEYQCPDGCQDGACIKK